MEQRIYDNDCHVRVDHRPWDVALARATIRRIAEEAERDFRPEGFWPSHPQDEEASDGHASLYFGAAGVIWGLHYLSRLGAISPKLDLPTILPRLIAHNVAEFAKEPYAAHGSLLIGDLGARIVAMRVSPDEALQNPFIPALSRTTIFRRAS